MIRLYGFKCKGTFKPRESEHESEKRSKNNWKRWKKKIKHQKKVSLSRSLSLGVNGLQYDTECPCSPLVAMNKSQSQSCRVNCPLKNATSYRMKRSRR